MENSGLIVSGSYLAYAISKFLGGILSDRVSARLLFATGLVVSGLATVLFAAFPPTAVVTLTACWFLNGLAQGCGWPACSKIILQWFAPEQLGTWWSLLSASANISGTLSPFLSAALILSHGWKTSLLVAGVVSVAWGLCALFILVNCPQDVGLPGFKPSASKSTGSKKGGEEGSTKDLIKSPFLWLVAGSYLAVMLAKTSAVDWGQLFLLEDLGHSQYVGSTFNSSLELGGFFGGILAGFLTDWALKNHKPAPGVRSSLIGSKNCPQTVFNSRRFSDLLSLSSVEIRPIRKGKKLGEHLDVPENFAYSSGWLQRFKGRFHISQRRLCGEGASISPAIIDEHLTNLNSILANSGYDPANIYNADETGLFFQLIPDRTLLCCNSTGTDKRRLLIIGKSAKPRCFRNFSPHFYCTYTSNSKAWMTSRIFQEWLLRFNKQLVSEGRRILLLLDNATSHCVPNDGLSNIKIHFLPPNMTANLQPLDSGIIKSFKAQYRKLQLQKMVELADAHLPTELRLDYAVRYCKMAWDSVSHDSISNCWNHTGIIRFTSTAAVEPLNYGNLLDHICDIFAITPENLMTEREFQLVDDSQEAEMKLTDDNFLVSTVTAKEELGEDDDATMTQRLPSLREARTAAETVLLFLEHSKRATSDDVNLSADLLRRVYAISEGEKTQVVHNTPRMKIAILMMAGTSVCFHCLYFVVNSQTSVIFISIIGAILGACLYGPIAIFGVVASECCPKNLSGTSHAIVCLAANVDTIRGVTVGSIISGLPFSYVAKAYSWAAIFLLLEGVTGVCTLAMLIFRNLDCRMGHAKID
ncbi:SLC37A4 [Cordylochernes scorpioides]|uniref:SLC37A4 n=1 Tax=Cordylochernes scorpioides TaxID=51811 RepID=A0ABY6LH10_9ARAC|nr:SLC37A4 [Cordylochernes scorpioides]